ncbi:helix-turn-helix domain-containing protein [Absiella sp. AM29-15]|uniref:helix-turn-helix domain-containing protein n=1 Tax=Absiella sp. AM29-15 TaxID=2292278 RepID=UPI000E4036CD|nr:helix-turn-helix transcriptional regulator [Absiella sp. AM29-15]RGC53919.1 XRE family transcriptional regulator [Absiella sp. AM29-15]
MLNENIKAIRKSKGLSQEELAVKLNVVRQTISKWEQGLSVPDADMLISISEIFETPVSTLLGENIIETKADDLKVISEKLEIINLQLANRKMTKQKLLHWLFISLGIVIMIVFIILFISHSPYLNWDYSNPETSVMGVVLHAFEWLFIRVAPLLLIGAITGVYFTRKLSNQENN